MPSNTYTGAPVTTGPLFTCSRCARVYPYPRDNGAPVRCECGWWYYNLGHGKMVEEYKPRLGGG